MDPEQMERAFDPFFSTKAQGTGLGLAITRQILEDHDGRIEVRSIDPRGTQLELRWPRRDAPVVGSAPLESAASSVES
jgi:two-component system NtrC family sensor kinase